MRAHQALLVSQSPVMRYGIAGVLESDNPGVKIREAGNAFDAVCEAISNTPTLVVIQEALAGVSGILAARSIRERAGRAHIIVLADVIDDDRIVAAVGHGVDAILPTEIVPQSFLAEIAALESGSRPLTDMVIGRPALAGRIFAAVREADDGARVAITESVPGAELSGSEIAVLDGVIRGISTDEMADRLGVPRYIVKHHFMSVLSKLRASDRTTALVSAARTGLMELSAQLPPPSPPGAIFHSAA